ncbi:MAG: phosphoribosylamine--glycine ligase [Ruminococcaceae bacterium]|nr:phosphoribosylamine--glycine ligase [Oscillospiraceae bacterium]
MNIIVIGSGGREHAIIKKLAQSEAVDTIYALPGNGGMTEAECVDVGAKDIPAIVEFAKTHDIGFAVVAPDDPLVLGCVDALEEIGIPCFGPSAAAAQIEGSKVFSKNLMKKYGIPTAAYEVFESADDAREYIKTCDLPIVIKADGLALGKGVLICMTREEAEDGLREIMEDKVFGASGNRVVIEEFLEGPEVSVLSFTDGKVVVPMVSSMDHKRIGDNDTGLNTGGMGTVAPNPYYTADVAAECMETIFLPTINAMNAEGRTFKGCLYFGLMITKNGPKVIEYNCRFGDPETQVVLPLLETDLFEIMQAVAAGELEKVDVKFKDAHACCVILASNGYPKKYATGFPMTLPEQPKHNAEIYIAGAKVKDGVLVTGGGRVLGVTAVADTLETAVKYAYEAAADVKFEGAYMRHDIGQRALQCK